MTGDGEKPMRTLEQIAAHLLNDCEGDNCECCNWPSEDKRELDNMTVETAERILYENGYPGFEEPCDNDPLDGNDEDDRTTFDMSDDADALASAGWGTDEDYGYYGGED